MFDATARPFLDLRSLIESTLESFLPTGELGPAIRYCVFSGGKRMRPMLTLLAAGACGREVTEAVPAACAIEFLHTASLIWDDMPCMDDTSERRGIPAAHVMFGEGVATLAALSLLNQTYSIFGRYRGLLPEAAECIGEMIEGQAVDLHGGSDRRNRKTTALMRLTLTAGAIACEARDADVRALARCGECLGEAYQIYDDFQDGDSNSDAGADELMAEAKSILRAQLSGPVAPLLSAIDAIAGHFTAARLVPA